MSFGGSGGSDSSIAGATDVTLSNPATDDYLGYDTTSSKWQNTSLSGKAALTNKGGAETVSWNSSISGSTTIDLTNGNAQSFALTGDTTFSFAGTVADTACSFALYLYTANGHTITWPSGVKWLNGEVPTPSGTGSDPDVFVFETLNSTTWFGVYVGKFS